MYLVHVHMRRPAGADVPAEIGSWVGEMAAPGHVEHVTVHAVARTHPVLGVYLLAERLEQAEQVALNACRSMLARRGELAGWKVAEGCVPLLAPVYDALLDRCPADVDETVQGPFRPHRSPSPGPGPEEE